MPGGRRLVAAAVLTLAAGAVMATAGYLFHTRGYATAAPVTLPAGLLISSAFALSARIAAVSAGDPAAMRLPWHRHALRAIIGVVVPIGGGGAPLVAQLASALLSTVSGALLALAGYAAAAWSAWLLPPLVLAGGVVIAGAFAATVVPVLRRARSAV